MDIKEMLKIQKDKTVQVFLKNLTPIDATDYSLQKATRKINIPKHRISLLRKWTTVGDEMITIRH